MRLPNFISFIFIFVSLWNFMKSTDTSDNSSNYVDGYGTEWVYFPDGDGFPHYASLSEITRHPLPRSRSDYYSMEYRLYIRNNSTDPIFLSENAEPIFKNATDFELAKLPLKIITHGWRSTVESYSVATIRNAYLLKQDVNVITVDWSYIANSVFFHWVANQTETIGIEIAMFLNDLSTRYNVTGEQVHLIGHSLGAHVMGIAAYNSNITVGRITGLDPARPLFEYPSRPKSAILDAGDAKFVDIIHTCSGVLGIELNVGTVDFFPNSGIPPQPGCETIPKILEACSHGRAFEYFRESIGNPKAFPSYQCRNWTEYLERRCDSTVFMGEEVNRNITGIFYLTTNPKFPFGRT